MSKSELVAYFLALPFVVAALFWVSPWIGWPGLVVIAPLWLGSLCALMFGERK